jgi:hypothetical protein
MVYLPLLPLKRGTSRDVTVSVVHVRRGAMTRVQEGGYSYMGIVKSISNVSQIARSPS